MKDNCIWLPRLGFEFKIPKQRTEFKYFGMGPWENYCDMHHASMVDYKNSGIGSASCGPELSEKYRLSEKDIYFNFVIK